MKTNQEYKEKCQTRLNAEIAKVQDLANQLRTAQGITCLF